MSVPVSVLIPVLNEEGNIGPCIDSVSWADDIVVVDSGSTDRTVEIARSKNARIVKFTYVPGGPKKKNWALDHVDFRQQWILIIDADERITPDLADEIAAVTGRGSPEQGYYINRRFYFLTHWIRHAGYFPSWNLRLFKRGAGRYERLPMTADSGDNEVHEHMIVNGATAFLSTPMDHYAYPTVSAFVEKHNRYSNWESKLDVQYYRGAALERRTGIGRGLLVRRKLKAVARRFPLPHWLRFAYHFVLRLGFLDGTPGYIFCHLLAEYEFLTWAKRLEHRTLVATQNDAKLP